MLGAIPMDFSRAGQPCRRVRSPLQQSQAGAPACIRQPVMHDVLPDNGSLQVQPQCQGMELDARELVIKACAVCGES